DPQILIIPIADTLNFQKGFLGVEDEQAVIEGELQIKGINPSNWEKLTISLRTVEAAFELEIELGLSEIVLFSRSPDSPSTFPSSFPFTIPLTIDTPQSIHTPRSSLAHFLTAKLHPIDPLLSSISKTLTVHTRRYSGHTQTIPVSPELHTLDDPTRVEVEVPRTSFKVEEPIPVYVTVPPPTRELVIDHGLRLRNVRTELVRTIGVKQGVGGVDPTDSQGGETLVSDNVTGTMISTSVMSSSSRLNSASSHGPTFKTVIARSGASCRFHSSLPVKLRFILRQSVASSSPSNLTVNLPSRDYGQFDSDADCASITQWTLLHSVTFQLNVYVSFVDMFTRRERISVLSVPIVIIPAPAPLPEVSQALDAAYQKKHDRPPSRTVRQDDGEYQEPLSREAGPSLLPTVAPPPFEERDAPPPFFFSEAEASTSARLPTFLESESEAVISEEVTSLLLHPPSPLIIGEGLEFGFLSSQQFDGHPDDMRRSPTPPPTLETATRDVDLTSMSVLHEPEHMTGAVGLALVEHHENAREERPPPPPPAMDDPSDPPPSIDSDFRSPETSGPAPNPPPPPHSSVPRETRLTRAGPAPPPYLIPDNSNDQEQVTRPPPYMD
ncbi:hypothetical protein BDZ94DRAFT_1120335, partial [Collybia nuda]